MKWRILSLTILLAAPVFASASVRITEIMYDVPGTDSGREWVEVCNDSDAVDLTNWKFFENQTNHALVLTQGSAMLGQNGCAIIADDPTKFLVDWPGFSGTIFDSSFSLSNTGETVSLRDANKTDVDVATYDASIGAGGDGNTLQWNGSGWVAAAPTPGSVSVGTLAAQGSGGQTDSSNSTSGPGSTSSTSLDTETEDDDPGASSGFPIEPQIFADAGADYSGVSGGVILFKGQALGKDKEPLASARYTWSFGDGTTADGAQVYHSYEYPGKYKVVLTVASGFNSGSDTAIANIGTAVVSITNVISGTGGRIEIKNGALQELNISGWILEDGAKKFVFPDNTSILAGQTVALSAKTTGISTGQGDPVMLLYPNTEMAAQYNWSAASQTTILAAAPVNKTPPSPSSVVVASPKTTQTKTAVASAAPQAPVSLEAVAQTASIDTATKNTAGAPLYWWIFALIAIAGAGVVSVFILKPATLPLPKENKNPFVEEAEEYDIEGEIEN